MSNKTEAVVTHPNHLLSALFMKEKDTKNTVKYAEVASEGNSDPFVPLIGSLYIQKSALKGGVPNAIKIDIDVT